jgi:hypothetical protein
MLHLRRVLPLARVVHDERLTLTLLSIDDLDNEFVLRLSAHPNDFFVGNADWSAAGFSAQDQFGSDYVGEVVASCSTPGGVDLDVSFTPALNSGARFVHLHAAVGDVHVAHLVPLWPTVGGAPEQQPSLPNAEAARVLEIAERVAMLMGHTPGVEHVLYAVLALAATTPFRPVLDALNLKTTRVGRAIVGLAPAPPRNQAMQLLSAFHVAASLGDPLIEPEHLLLAVVGEYSTRVEQVLTSLGLTRQLVYGLLRAHHDARRTWRAHTTLRRVVAPTALFVKGPHTLTLMSVEDHVDAFVLRGHFDSDGMTGRSALEHLSVLVQDDRFRQYASERIQIHGYSNGRTCSLSLTWRSQCPLPDDAARMLMSVPWLESEVEVPLERAARVQHA